MKILTLFLMVVVLLFFSKSVFASTSTYYAVPGSDVYTNNSSVGSCDSTLSHHISSDGTYLSFPDITESNDDITSVQYCLKAHGYIYYGLFPTTGTSMNIFTDQNGSESCWDLPDYHLSDFKTWKDSFYAGGVAIYSDDNQNTLYGDIDCLYIKITTNTPTPTPSPTSTPVPTSTPAAVPTPTGFKNPVKKINICHYQASSKKWRLTHKWCYDHRHRRNVNKYKK